MDRGSKRAIGITGRGRSRRGWNAAEAESVLRRWRSGEESLLAFCRRGGLNYYRVLRWRKRLSTKSTPGPRFYPVRVVTSPPAQRLPEPHAPLTVVLRGDRRLLVPTEFDASAVQALVRALEQC